jgi:hypothetical protein
MTFAEIQANADLIRRLEEVQNSPSNDARDIMSFAGFCDTRAELERHVLKEEARAARR